MDQRQNKRRVVDVKPQGSGHNRSKRDEDDPPVRIPLEMWPVIKTLVGYGRRTYGLGGLRGVAALGRIVDSLVPLAGGCPELVDVIKFAQKEAEEIRALAFSTVNGEQDES